MTMEQKIKQMARFSRDRLDQNSSNCVDSIPEKIHQLKQYRGLVKGEL